MQWRRSGLSAWHRQPRPLRAFALDLLGATAVAVALIAGVAGRPRSASRSGWSPAVFGGWIDQLISRLIDVWMAFPPVLLSIVLAAVIGAGLTSVILAIVVVDWTRFARVVRAETMVQLQRDYATAAARDRL